MYFFQVGDDLQITDPNIFVEILDIFNKNKFCAVWPIDSRNLRIPTFCVLTRDHYKIFGYFFEPALENWYLDDWILGVYSDHIHKTKGPVIFNSSGTSRYVIKHVSNLNELISIGQSKLHNYLSSIQIPETLLSEAI